MRTLVASLLSAGLLAAVPSNTIAGHAHGIRSYSAMYPSATPRQLRNLRAYERGGEYYEQDPDRSFREPSVVGTQGTPNAVSVPLDKREDRAIVWCRASRGTRTLGQTEDLVLELAKRHGISRNLVRIWAAKAEAGDRRRSGGYRHPPRIRGAPAPGAAGGQACAV